MFHTGHLFAGAGGGLLADRILGHQPIVAVEWDKYACAILRERFPGTRVIEGDVRSVDFARELAGIDALCAGFPCQDISAAGKGVGITGARSGLYREVMRAIDAVRPPWVFLENSPRIRTRGRHVVIADLVARGYSWRDGILGAADVGAPHQRDRWWCLARRSDTNGVWELQPQGREQEQRGWTGDMVRQVADTDRHAGGSRWPDHADEGARGRDVDRGHQRQNRMADAGGIRLEKPQPSEEGDQQQATAGTCRSVGWWSVEPGMGRMAHGVANRPHRIKCLGNGQVPLCAATAWCLLGGPMNHEAPHNTAMDGSAPHQQVIDGVNDGGAR